MSTIAQIAAAEVQSELSAALLEIDSRAPMQAETVERETPRDGLDLATHTFLRPDDAVLIARDDAGQIAGFAVAKLRQGLFDGQLATHNYLAHLRVLPERQRQGIGSALLRAHLAYGQEAGATVHWAAVESGNQASLGAFHKSGFVDARSVRALGFPAMAMSRLQPTASLRFGTAKSDDLGEATALLNRLYEDYNAWRPLAPDHLGQELFAGASSSRNYGPEDLVAVHDAAGALRAVALVYDQPRVVRRIVEEIQVPTARLLARLGPVLSLSPASGAIPRLGVDHPKLFLHYFAATDRDAALALVGGVAREWEQRTRGLSWDRRPAMLVVQDEGNILKAPSGLLAEAGFLLGRAPYPTRVHVLVRTDRAFDRARPWWLNFWT